MISGNVRMTLEEVWEEPFREWIDLGFVCGAEIGEDEEQLTKFIDAAVEICCWYIK